jgi:hypothetical protein
MRAFCVALTAAVAAAVPVRLTREFSVDISAASGFANAVDLEHISNAIADAYPGSTVELEQSSRRQLQTGSTALRVSYTVACGSSCDDVNDALTTLASDSTAGAAHAAAMIAAVNEAAASVGFSGTTITSTAEEIAATFTLPETVDISLPPSPAPEPPAPAPGALDLSSLELRGSATVVAGDVLELHLTEVEGSQRGSAFIEMDVTSTDTMTLTYDFLTGGGTGADGQCVTLGNDVINVVEEDGVTEGVSICFDEYASSTAEHGIVIFYNGEAVWSYMSDCAGGWGNNNEVACPPVSMFTDNEWHTVDIEIIATPGGGAVVSFDMDSGAFLSVDPAQPAPLVLDSYSLPDTVYLGFTGRTGGATNAHWVRNVYPAVTVGAGVAHTNQYLFSGDVDDTTGDNHGTITGGLSYTVDRFGVDNEALAFTGSEFVTVPTPFVAGDADFTIAVWLKPTVVNDASWHGFCGRQDGTRSPSLWVNWNGGGGENDPLDFGLHWDTRTTQNGDGSRYNGVIVSWFLADTYVHTVWTATAGEMNRFYKDGAITDDGTVEAAAAVDLHEIYTIGKVDNNFIGSIDEVAFYDFAVSAADIAVIYTSTSPSGTADGASAVYLFNGNFDDTSGTKHGTVAGADSTPTLTIDRLGTPNSAYSFDGGDYITTDTPFTTGDEAYTIELWLKPTLLNDGSWHGFCGYQDGTRSPSLWVNFNGCDVGVCDNADAGNNIPGDGMHWDTRTTQNGSGDRFASVVDDWFALNTYVHTVWTHAAQDKFYKNGVLRDDATMDAAPHVDLHDTYNIGRVDNFFVGVIDEVQFYNYELDADSILEQYTVGADGMPATGDCENSFTATMFKFNLDPADDNTGLRNWDGANSIQLAEVALYNEDGVMIQDQSTATNPGGNNPGGEPPSAAADGAFPDTECAANCNHKWLDFNKGDLVLTFDSAVTVVQYDWMTANDAPDRDPSKWTLEASVDDGSTWVVIEDSCADVACEPTAERYTWQGPYCVMAAEAPTPSPSINLDQLDGVSASLPDFSVFTADDAVVPDDQCHDYGCGFHAQHGTDPSDQAPLLIDNDHSPGSWAQSPNGDSNDCTTRIFATIDLGALYMVTGVTIWHYYGNDRAYCSQKIAVSATGGFVGEEYVAYDTGSDNGPPEASAGNSFTFPPTYGQFVRHWCSRSTSNSGIHMMEIDVYGSPNTPEIINLDQLSGVSASGGPGVNDRGDPNSVIDMDHSPAAWVDSPTGSTPCTSSLYMTIDLGDYYLVTGVTIWHYYGNDRAYCSQMVATSVTGEFAGEEYVAWDTGMEAYGPPESVDGNAITFPAKVARYVRHWSSRSTSNAGVHFLEIDVYGVDDPVPAPPPVPNEWSYVGCFRDNEGARDFPGAINAVARVPAAAADECSIICDGFAYFGLQWQNECFCGNSYNNGNGNNNNQGDCPGGVCPIEHCDADGVLDDDGTASLCSNGVNDCGNRNAVYSMIGAIINLDQMDGVSASLPDFSVFTADDAVVPDDQCHDYGCGFHAQHGTSVEDQAPLLIDNDHSPGSWAQSPNGDSNDCTTRIFATIDLGALYVVSGVTIWHYYGNDRAYCSQKVAVSSTGGFVGEEFVAYDTGSDNGPPESVDGNSFTFAPTYAQFVRHWCSRSTSNSGIHMMEIDVYGMPFSPEPFNLDQLDGVVASGGPGVDDRGAPESVIDMNHSPGAWPDSPTGGPAACDADLANSLYMTIDLGDYYLVTGVTIWHYYGNDRAYCSQRVATSATGEFAGEEYVAWDTGAENGPPESVDGNAITFPAKVARYVRHWSAGSTSNPYVHFLEIDVYGLPDPVPAPPSPVPEFGAYIGCFRDNEGARDFPGAITAVARVPYQAAVECAGVCAGFNFFGLQWQNECFCGNSYNNGNGNNNIHDDCPDGVCPIEHCDADGVLDDDGTASLCSNGEGNCGNRNAVYNTVPVTTVFEYVGCFRDNEGARDFPGAITAVARVPFAAANECAAVCDGFSYFGLQWENECFCGNSYNNGNGNNNNQGDCPDGVCPIAHCDADEVLDDDGTASLCSNGQGNCGNRNAVYCVGSC